MADATINISACKNIEHLRKRRSVLNSVSLLAPLILLSISHQINASGVFELELIKLQQLDFRHPNENSSIRSSESHNQQVSANASHSSLAELESYSKDLVRILVCLKEAFTSQLDGPCTFGNASITLNRDSIEQANSATNAPRDWMQDQLGRQNSTLAQHQQGSQLTNIVRILFTFRWTKSFTIILTAEQPHPDIDNQQQQAAQIRRPAQLVALRYERPTVNGSSSEPLANRSTIGPINPSTTYASSNRFVDRHVLTENEVLPNLEPNPNKPWTSRFSRSLKSSLAYRFRVYCSLNYYGDGCTTFCRARDDQFGHYNCSSTGQKLCLDGWQGTDCDKAKCRSGCNLQHGYCDKPDTCQCRPGWSGARCDECITYPGCQNGYCLSPWQCICQRNWGGVLCDQDLNYCGTHEPCKNNGTCQNIAPGKYKCHCSDGFTGVDCNHDTNLDLLSAAGGMTQLSAGCALNPCLNGGSCFGFDSILLDSGQASAGPVPSSLPEGTLQTGTSELGDRFYRCQCAQGWSGDYCQWSDSATSLSTASLIVNDTAVRPNSTSGVERDALKEDSSLQNNETADKIPSFITTIIENPAPTVHLDMKHLISGVVIASIVGVLLASLLLAWCCLLAIEQNKFPFIQMNIISSVESGGVDGPVVASTLRRIHGKIRDSLRRSSRSRIKPETKLSIENVLRPAKPPPSYEESGNCRVNTTEVATKHPGATKNVESLVIRGALEQKLASYQSISSTSSATANCEPVFDEKLVTSAQLTCPRHGYLYRQQSNESHSSTISVPTSLPSSQQQAPYFHQHVTRLYHPNAP